MSNLFRRLRRGPRGAATETNSALPYSFYRGALPPSGPALDAAERMAYMTSPVVTEMTPDEIAQSRKDLMNKATLWADEIVAGEVAWKTEKEAVLAAAVVRASRAGGRTLTERHGRGDVPGRRVRETLETAVAVPLREGAEITVDLLGDNTFQLGVVWPDEGAARAIVHGDELVHLAAVFNEIVSRVPGGAGGGVTPEAT